MKWIGIWTCILSSSIAGACTQDGSLPFDDNDDLESDDALMTTADWEDWATSAVFAATDPLADPSFDDGALRAVSNESPTAADAAAELVADNVNRYYTPADCANVERQDNALTYTLSDCATQFSSASLSGTLRVSFDGDVDGDGISFELSSENLRIDGVDGMLSANGVYSAAGSSRTVKYSSRRTLTGDETFAGQFDSTLVWTAGSDCVTRNATGAIVTPTRNSDATIDGYMRCGNACPIAGLITLNDDDEDDDDPTLTFDGGNQAVREHANDDVDLVELDCD